MRKLLVLVACLSQLLPSIAMAGSPPHWNGHPGGHPPPGHGHQPDHGYTHYYPGYRYYGHAYHGYYPYYAPAYYYGDGYGHHHDNDDALWAIGGLIVGAVIGTAVERSQHPPTASPPPASAPAPQAGPPAGCRDTIVYDSAGNPRVQRDCND